MDNFSGTLLHEIVHARTGYADVTREFELALTHLMGTAAALALVAPAPATSSLMATLFGRA
jgi:hypothetical protein